MAGRLTRVYGFSFVLITVLFSPPFYQHSGPSTALRLSFKPGNPQWVPETQSKNSPPDTWLQCHGEAPGLAQPLLFPPLDAGVPPTLC